jgi:tetratricopeptide (TPR) repeat protein
MFIPRRALALGSRARRWTLAALGAAAALGIAATTLGSQPETPAERLDRAMVLALEHKPERALRELRRALAALNDDDRSELRQRILMRAAQLTEMHLSDAHLPEALRYYRTVEQDYAGLPAAYEAGVRTAEILRNRLHDGFHAEAQFLSLMETFRSQPGIEALLVKAAESAQDDGRPEVAQRHLERLIAEHPVSAAADEARSLLADLHRRQGRLEAATALLIELAERKSGTEEGARALARAGDCFAQQGDYAHAVARYIESLPNHPDPVQVQRSLERARRRFQLLRPAAREERALASRRVDSPDVAMAGESGTPGETADAEPSAMPDAAPAP